jgi:hypothetical protein
MDEDKGESIHEPSPSPVVSPVSPSGGPEGAIAWALSWFLAPLAAELVDIATWSAARVRECWRRVSRKSP